ncbi:MAG: phosphoribosyl-AMP cyclohydrolase [Euryarchaeota archaeon]|nr:phosphoribosyl-AMP cyclohydrolase [Euryarchaeota archaeon]
MKISDEILKELKFDDKGLLTAVAQDFETNEILMVAFMNLEALLETIETEKAHYYSRSRAKQWLKGESSGHIQIVHEMYIDCDADAVVMKVEQVAGGACHTGYRSCFYRTVDGNIVGEKVFNPEEVY